jgi:voltage-gated potassium channel Kch/CheY-like chemotaxis protein
MTNLKKMKKSAAYLFQVLIFVSIVITVGTAGYLILEDGWSFKDALYMTVITISTVGYGETHELSSNGRYFTMVLIFMGFGTVALFASQLARFIIESEIKGIFGGQRMQNKIKKLKSHYIVCGFGRIGKSICAELKKENIPFVVIEIDELLIEESLRNENLTIKGNATSDTALAEAGIDHAIGVIAGLTSDADNLFISLAARELNPTTLIIARGEDPGVEDRMLRAGADIVVSPMFLGGQQIAQIIKRQAGITGDQAEVAEATSVLGFSLRVFRNTSKEIFTVQKAIDEVGAVSAIAIKHEDGSLVNYPDLNMEISEYDSVILLVRDEENIDSIGADSDSKRILLVDDHKALLFLFARKIRAAGHEVITAQDGVEALELAKRYIPDLVVLDVEMPKLNGYQACAELKADAALKSIPVILYSATAENDFFENGKKSGADECIRKSNKSSELLEKIEEILIHGGRSVLVVNPKHLLEMTDGDLTAINESIDLFWESIPRHEENFAKGFEKSDFETLRKEAHAIKGGAGNMGFDEVHSIAKEMEGIAKAASDISEVTKCHGRLVKAIKKLKKELKTYDWKTLVK